MRQQLRVQALRVGLLVAGLVSCSDPSATGSSDDFSEQGWLAASIHRLGKPLEGAVQELDRGTKLTPRAPGAPAVLLDHESGAFEVQTRSGTVRVMREGGPWSIRSTDETTVHMGRKQGDIDVRFFALHDRVEELVRVPSRSTRVAYRFELSSGQRLIQRHQAVPAVDVVEGAGFTTLRMAAPKLWDRDGEEFPIALSLEADRVVLEAPENARFPVVMDPVWLSASLSPSRSVHTATLLLNGKVLLAGGAGEANRTAELYDPDHDSYEALPALADNRITHTATLLRNGKVLIAGGLPDYQTVEIRTAELFDPETLTFERTGDLVHGRGRHSATLLADGRVLLVGGTGLNGAIVTEAELYDPETGKFKSVGSPTFVDFPHAAVRLADGTAALLWNNPTEPPRVELFDPALDTFIDPGIVFPPDDLVTGADPAAFRSPTSDELVVRTSTHSCSIDLVTKVPSCQLVDVDLQYGPGVAGAPEAISQLGETMFAFGGTAPGGQYIQRYVPESDTPWGANEEAAGQESHTSTALPGDSVLVAGGLLDDNRSKLFFDPRSFRAVVENPALLPLISAGHATTLLADGRVLIAGGTSGSLTVSAQDGLDAPQPLGALLAKRHGHRAILLDSGQVLIAGGDTDPADAAEELFDPSTGVSTALGFRLSARSNAVAMPGARVLFAGPALLQILDTKSWSVVSEYTHDLFCTVPRLARLASGRVAVVGENSVFTVGPGSQDTSPPAALQSPRCNPVVVALPDGAVLIAGGDQGGTTSELADVFYPETGRVQFQAGVPFGVASVPGHFAFGRVRILSGPSSTGQNAAGMSYHSLGVSGEWVNRTASSNQSGTQTMFGMRAGTSVTRLVDGGFLTAGVLYMGESTSLLWGWSGASFRLSKPLLRVKPGQEIDLDDLPFSTTWPEGSSGTTQASPTDAPVPVWTPATDGWPVAGTFLSWSANSARWRVPNTPFPGIGFLSYVLHGTQHPLMPVEIQAAELGATCETNSECESGFCADGVCCESACDAPCESCSAATKGEGEDGTCGPTPAGKADSDCEVDDVKTCGQTGECDGASACALYPEGTPCNDESAVCAEGVCTQVAISICNETTNVSISADGIEDPCKPYRCALSNGRCLIACATSRECAAGNDCNAEGECAPSSELPHYSLGCTPGCRLADRGRRPALTLAALLGLVISARARRRSRRRRG